MVQLPLPYASTGQPDCYRDVTMQDFYYGQIRALAAVASAKAGFAQRSPESSGRSWVSGCNSHYKFVMAAGAKQKP